MNFSALARSYNSLSHKDQLRALLSSFLDEANYSSFNKYQLAQAINEILIKNYEGEQRLKYLLAKEFITKNYVAAFEVRAKTSRTDFLAINGVTHSFEVKSKIDSLARLKKQTEDYGTVFEYNTVVIDKKHLKKVIELVPAFYGIWYYEKNRKIEYRQASYSPKLNSWEQLLLFNKKELKSTFGSTDKTPIIEHFDATEINEALKLVLKGRYKKRWQFLQVNWKNILPIDLQFFFNTNVEPALVYGLQPKH
jgi:hypothetical protein